MTPLAAVGLTYDWRVLVRSALLMLVSRRFIGVGLCELKWENRFFR